MIELVKQFYLQANWKHSIHPKHKRQSSYFQLGTEQAASVSPLDYWGNLQKYYFKFQFSILEQPLSMNRVTLDNDFYATYSDANWVDSRRRLARSTVNQWYGRHLNLQNQFSLHFQQKPLHSRLQSTVPKLRQQVLRINSGVKTIRLFHSAQDSYWNFGMNYYWLWHRRNAISSNIWHLMLGGQLQQSLLTTIDIRPELTQFPTAPWQGRSCKQFGLAAAASQQKTTYYYRNPQCQPFWLENNVEEQRRRKHSRAK